MNLAAGAPPERLQPATAAQLFELLWTSLTDVLGSATTATLLRRSRNNLVPRLPELEDLRIDRRGLEYGYTLPESWKDVSTTSMEELRQLVDELGPLLVQLTGSVILRKLAAIPAFSRNGIVFVH